jgi:hypothetical protein
MPFSSGKPFGYPFRFSVKQIRLVSWITYQSSGAAGQ